VPSWPTVVVSAVVIGGLLGAAQAGGRTPAQSSATPSALSSPSTSADATRGHARTALPSPDASAWPDTVRQTLPPEQPPRIALTFDDGPDPRWTPQILDVLAAHGAVATFCVVGEQVTGREALLRRVAEEGHVLCNHTSTHDYGLPARDPERLESEIARVNEQITEAVPGVTVHAFRAPGGRFDDTVVAAARGLGLTSWGWSSDPQDWQSNEADAIVAAVLDGIGPDEVVLLHDGGGDRSATVEAVGELVSVLSSVGYEFVGLPDVT